MLRTVDYQQLIDQADEQRTKKEQQNKPELTLNDRQGVVDYLAISKWWEKQIKSRSIRNGEKQEA